ncbi:hypothetical protein CASFOL_009810 [Castilleja foliolosa]|uniref:BHLH domain-containing protein n=1 Tax=Castilleja foliolosa TaxID=1961234 RepID=A0ABD3DQX6_9LAMI
MQQPNNASDAYFGLGGYDNIVASTLTYPEVSQISPWALPQAHPFNPTHFSAREPDPFPQPYGGFFNMRRPFGYESGQFLQPSGSAPFGLQSELTAQEIMEAKALAASKSHSEAERRRRERINNHLAKLRSLLPSTIKTDKASLLAEVIQHLNDLKRQTTLIEETSPVPTETDELTVDNYVSSDEDGKWVIRASICCDDRPDLLPELIKTLKEMRLKTLKAEIITLGGRVKNVLFITGEDDNDHFNNCFNGGDEDGVQEHQQYCIISAIEEALKAVMEKLSGDENGSLGCVKRQRTNTQ